MSEEMQNGGFEEQDGLKNEVNAESAAENEVFEQEFAENTNNAAQSPLFGGNGGYYYGYHQPSETELRFIKTAGEKREIRKIALAVGLPCIFMFVLTQIWSYIYLFVMTAAGFTAQRALEIVTEPAVLQAAQIVLSIIMFLVPFAIVAGVTKNRISDLIPFEKPKKGTVLPLFLIGIGFCMLSNICSSILGRIFESFGVEYNVPDYGNPDGFFGFCLVFLSTVMIPALVEEFGCRGVIQGLLKKYGDGFSIIISAIIFGVIHGNFDQMFFAFFVGLILGFVRIKSGSIWVCCLIHGANNLVPTALSYLDLETGAKNILTVIIFCGAMLCSVLGLALYGRSEDAFELEKAECECTETEKYKFFLLSPAFIITVALFVLEAVMFFF